MAIVPTTLKVLRNSRGLSRKGLADLTAQIKGCRVSQRQISRIEKGETRPENVRQHTIDSLAKALEVRPEVLCMPPTDDAVREAMHSEADYRRVSVLLDQTTRLNYWLVKHHYKASTEDLINAAPWMFTLLAEMSLADRRRRLDEATAALDAATNCIPDHLRHAHAGRSDIDEAYFDEEESLSKRDVFGELLLQTSSTVEPFDPHESNPFLQFLRRAARGASSDAIDADELMLLWAGEMPRWPIFRSWLDQLTGGDVWAHFALVDCGVSLAQMPPELESMEKTNERIAWIVGKIPPEAREREEQQQRAEVDKL
jgi:transcriptional regulator with XRE-family HTH domain